LPNALYAADARDCQKTEAVMSKNVKNKNNSTNSQSQGVLNKSNIQIVTHQSLSGSGGKTKVKVNLLYSRLSKDDEMQGPSNSIINQQHLLQEYAEANGLIPYVHLADDGWSGTRWDRPSWQKLIEMVEVDEVSCVCIKDSSRLGRDYLRVGLYREMFKERGVRLIAINDNLDTARGDDDFTPFREIMAEWYARDASKKIKSVYAAKAKAGKPTSNTPPTDSSKTLTTKISG